MNIKLFELPVMKLNLFDGNLNPNKTTDTTATTGNDLSGEMKTFYSNYLIRLAEPLLVHDQFGQKHPIPKNGGKQIEFRKYDSLPKALTPLSEGVTPDGQKMNMSTITAAVHQYGNYITLTDVLLLTAIDNNMMEATRMISDQAGKTGDTITREVLAGGTNVQYGEGTKLYRYKLVGGDSTAANNDYMSITAIRKAVRCLKVNNAKKINGDFCAIIHPDVAYDLMEDSRWINVKTYSDPDDIYEGEIGKIEGVRFVETSEAKVFHAENLTANARNLSVKTAIESSTTTVAVKEAISSAEATALAGRMIIIGTGLYKIASASAAAAGSATLTLDSTTPITAASANDPIYPGEAGAAGRDVYATLIIGSHAYGVTEIEGGGLQHIVKQLGSGGTSDPLNQRATVGWKMFKAAERLVEQYMIRVETASTFEVGAN